MSMSLPTPRTLKPSSSTYTTSVIKDLRDDLFTEAYTLVFERLKEIGLYQEHFSESIKLFGIKEEDIITVNVLNHRVKTKIFSPLIIMSDVIKKNKIKINIEHSEELNLTEYLIEFKSKSGKILDKIEKIESLQKVVITKENSNSNIQKPFKKRKFKKRKFVKKKIK